MIDWNWLWVAGELGIAYGLYRWSRSHDKFLAVLEIAPDIDIDDLKKLSALNHSVEYAAVHGLVQPVDSKSTSTLNSHYVPHCKGVMQRLTIRELKLEKFRTFWSESNKIISDITRHVPFRLASPTGNSIRIDKPMSFSDIEDHLDVTHVHFQPNRSSSFEKIVDTLLGELSTGVETKEQMLLIDTPLTGVGRLEKHSNGQWCLVPHSEWGGILTRGSRGDIVAEYRDHSHTIRIFSIFFAIAAGCTAAYFLYQYYRRERHRRSTRLPNVSPIDDTTVTDTSAVRLRCVICMDNEVVYSLQPCSHLGLCHSCAQTLQSRASGEELCPICRVPIQYYQRVFLP